jgi:transposase-like protein
MDKSSANPVTESGELVKKELANKYNRVFSTELKQKIVLDFEKNRLTIPEICDLYGVTRTSVYKWIYKYSLSYQSNTKMVVQMESEGQKNKDLNRQVADLLQIIGKKQVELDLLHEILAQAGNTYGVDLKKNFGSGASSTSSNAPPTKSTL